VSTYCIGRAYSGAAVLLCSGAKGKRYILPHAKVMIHQPYGGVTGQAEDIRIQAEQIIKAKAELNRIIASHTGQDFDKVHRDASATSTSAPPRRGVRAGGRGAGRAAQGPPGEVSVRQAPGIRR
jgi:ATP-dependent Clp endopeptidase proteolytic subunit ClpP